MASMDKVPLFDASRVRVIPSRQNWCLGRLAAPRCMTA